VVKVSNKSIAKRRLVSQCDALVRKLVLSRDGYKCCKCGGINILQAAHILSKGPWSRIRFAVLNVLTLCLRCHLYWGHRDPIAFVDWLNEKYPGRIEQLKIIAATSPKLDMKLIRLALQIEVNELDPPSKAVLPDLECAKSLPF
jgi:hypothetical protein